MAAPKRQNVTISESSQNGLPDELVENIIAFLPPKETANLSIMSKRFRYTWKSCRNLSFDNNFAQNYNRNDYTNIVNHFFQNRADTNIDRFKLFFNPWNAKDLVRSWIDRCVDSGIKELELDFSCSPRAYVQGSNLLGVETLEILRLINVELDTSKIPSSFISNLSELRFQYVKPTPATVQAIFSNCLGLRTFEVMNCNKMYHLNICAQNQKGFKELVVKYCNDIRSIRLNAPTLCTLHYHGKICEFIFYSNFPRLEDVILDITPSRGSQTFPHIEHLVAAIRNVTTLTVTSPFLEMLYVRTVGNKFREWDYYLMNLKEFHLIVQRESYINPFDIIMFLKKCSRLERVFIDVAPNSFENSMFWDFHGRASVSQCRIIFPFIKSVKIKGFTLKELHVTMARFFLNSAKNLQHLVLIKARNDDFPQIFSPECLRWETESQAQIEIYEHRNDRSNIFPKYFSNVCDFVY